MPFDPAAHPTLTALAEQLRELAGDAAYKAGRDYCKKGLVRQTAVAGTTAHATVSGSTDYRVSAAFAQEPKVSCTCPAHRRSKYCKHVVAVLTALLEQPGSFVVAEPVPEAEQPAATKKTRAPKGKSAAEAKAESQTAGLATIDSLLLELAGGGLVTLGPEQAALLAGAGELVRALKLRRMGNQILRLQRAANGAQRLESSEYAGLLGDLYLTRTAVGAHLEGRAELDPALAEELLGKVWREGDLERTTGLELLEVAATRDTDGEFTVEAGYLADLNTGQIFVEKLITPVKMSSQGRTRHRHRLLVDEGGLYPGLSPRRIKLVRARRAPLSTANVERLAALATDSVAVLRQRVAERLASPFGPVELPVLFRPHALVTQGTLAGAVDGEGRFLSLSLPDPWLKELPALLPDTGCLLFGLLGESGAGLHVTCLSLISPAFRWWKGPIYPDGPVRSRR